MERLKVHPKVNASPFQLQEIGRIEEEADFAHFCGAALFANWIENERERKPGPITITWYAKGGDLWVEKVGLKRVLRRLKAK